MQKKENGIYLISMVSLFEYDLFFCFIQQIMESAIILEGWNVQWIQNRNEEQKCLKLDKWFNTIFYTISSSFFSINLPIYVYCTLKIFLNLKQRSGLNSSVSVSRSGKIKIIDLLFQTSDIINLVCEIFEMCWISLFWI